METAATDKVEGQEQEEVLAAGGNRSAGAFWRGLLINQNPFYLISAALVFLGLNAGFGTDDIWINTTIPLTIMLTYAAVLSGIAVVLIRRGKVWEDVRSILLALGILFFNLSAALDELLVRETEGALMTVAAVWLLVPALVELLRRGLGIRWPRGMAIAVHATLILMLAYPAITAHLLLAKEATMTAWSIAAFPVVGAIVLLALIPAVRRLGAGAWDNGTPWRWLELVTIVALPLALLARTYLLATAFYPFPSLATGGYGDLDTAFGGWCCVPIVLAALVLLLEYGVAADRAWCRRLALYAAPALVPLAMIGPSGGSAFFELRQLVADSLASPVLLTAVAVVAFAAIACLRRLAEAWGALFVAVLALSPIGAETISWQSLQAPSWLPMSLAAIGCFAALNRYRHSVCFLGGWLATIAALVSVTDSFHGTLLTVLVAHALLLGLVLAALGFRDVLARAVVQALAFLLPLLLVPALWLSDSSLPDPGLTGRLAYVGLVICLCYAMGQRFAQQGFQQANLANLAQLGVFLLAQLGIFLQHLELRGSWRIVAGVATLTLAVWISWQKSRPELADERSPNS